MNKKELKKENRKAFLSLIVVMILSGLGGGILGVASSFLEGSTFAEKLQMTATQIFQRIVPWGIPATAVGLLIPAILLLQKAYKNFKRWDGEEEQVAERIDRILNKVLLLSSLSVPLCIFFISCIRTKMSGIMFVEFLAAVFIAMGIQQKVVDLIRLMNPEKKGSVYEFKFQKKWFDSCDEAERKKIGEASYKSYKATQMSCIILWLILYVMDVGLVPIFVVLLIFCISTISYMMEAIK